MTAQVPPGTNCQRLTCKDYGDRPECLGDADERYTMRFDDIGENPIYWCAFCGPEANAMSDALITALETRGPEFRRVHQDSVPR